MGVIWAAVVRHTVLLEEIELDPQGGPRKPLQTALDTALFTKNRTLTRFVVISLGVWSANSYSMFPTSVLMNSYLCFICGKLCGSLCGLREFV